MDYHIFKSMVNGCYAPYVGYEKRPTFFDINETYPELNRVTECFPEIREELEDLLQSETRLPRYHDVDAGEAKISNTTGTQLERLCWRSRPSCGRQSSAVPRTCAAVARVPNVIQAFFSILDPGKSIPAHEGPYLGYLRYHLALRVPEHNPPCIVVNHQPYTWKLGEAVLFDDSHLHEVINHSDGVRCVLIIDVLRPMPMLPTMLNRATTLIARHTYGRKVANEVQKFAKKAA
ncbi:MAG: aspartyl/asparaginyl beta-hydroxylase domain-containing protein [Planctomycetaceae bacterium]